MSNHTGLFDSDGRGIVIGSIVRKAVTGNKDVHGEWAEYEVKQQGMTPILSYLRSEKGEALPAGYLASILADEYDRKMFLFATKVGDLRPTERMTVTHGQTLKPSVPCMVVQELAEWLAEIEADLKVISFPEDLYGRGYEQHVRVARRRLKGILDANNASPCEGGRPNA